MLAPAGVTARELIEEYCGGMQDGEVFKAYLPGGASGGILPASMADEPLDFGTLEKYGCFVGSHAVVILSEKDDMKAVALNLLKFFEDESCGQCTPCRVGTEKAVKLMETGPWDAALLTELSDLMRDASICGLGQAAPNPLLCVLKYFRMNSPSRWGVGHDEDKRHIHRCHPRSRWRAKRAASASPSRLAAPNPRIASLLSAARRSGDP